MTTTATTTVVETTPPAGNPNKRRFVLALITLAFILIAVAYAAYYLLVLSKEEDTDNAYVSGNLVMLSSQVTGNVQEIRADETQMVKAGAQIVTLDATDAKLALSQSEAHLGEVVRQLRERYSNVAQYDSSIQVRKLALKNAQDDLARRLPLAQDHTVSGEEVQHARQAVLDASAALDVTVKQADAQRAGVAGVKIDTHPAVLAARAELVQAWLAERRTAILAPVSGYVAKRAVQVGSHVTPGTALLSIVPLDQLWIDANFKESQLTNIRVGQDAHIEADVYGSKVVYHGKVMGMSAGTGSAFSLLPAQNATGNWIKVVQRVPVRISLDPRELASHPLRIGLSTTATVDVSRDGAALGSPAAASAVYTTAALNQPVADAETMADKIIRENLVN
jgi:membrane fusion protein (multidrug efflux system)